MGEGHDRLAAMSIDQKRALLQRLLTQQGGHSEYPTSYGQRALWLLYELAPVGFGYNVGCRWHIASPVNVNTLKRALQMLAERHAVLRTTFSTRETELLQRVGEAASVDCHWSDASAWSADDLAQRLQADARRPFDLRRMPAFRAHLFSRGPADHVLQLTFHHIVYDLRSGEQLARELSMLYEAAHSGVPPALSPVAVDFVDYVRWEHSLVTSAEGERLWTYWRNRLSGAAFALDLPFDSFRPAVQTFDGRTHTFELSEALSAQVRSVARTAGSTPYVVLLTAFFALLYRYTGQEDIIVGTPAAGRSRAEFNDVVGYLVNPLPIRARVHRGLGFRDLLSDVREHVLAAIEHSELPFPLIVERLGLMRDPSRSPVFQVAFTWNALDHLDQNVGAAAGSLPMRHIGAGQEGANFDLELAITEKDRRLGGWWRYNTDLFHDDSIARMALQFERLLRSAVEAPSSPIADLPLLNGDERGELLTRWNPIAEVRPAAQTLVQWFELQAARTPGAVAVSCGETSLTYDELNRRANQIANWLAQHGVRAGSAVGLYVDRSVHLPVAIVGILKAGGAYVPLDPAYPADRVRYILDDAHVDAVVTITSLQQGLPDVPLLCMDNEAAVARQSEHSAAVVIDPASLAYIIYTSGSTGRPKGVGVTHANVVRLFAATELWFAFGPTDVWTLFHSAAFDFSVWELWGPLLSGGRVVIVPYWISRAPDAFRALLADEGVTVLNQTPSAFRQLIEADESATSPLALRYVIFGGEALHIGALRPWVGRYGLNRPQLVNMYGITETTVHVTCRVLRSEDVADGSRSVIGAPIADLQVYLLDDRHEPVPLNVRGELYVGGSGLARGYVGRPRLTAERFLPDPFSGVPGARLYRSGDSARRLTDGDVEYLGRLDHQVKVRGFRIELGEIEQAVRAHPAVRDVVVHADRGDDGDTRIAAYVVPDAAAAPVRRLLEWERAGRLPNGGWHELPNGLGIVQLNRNETDFLYDEIFGNERYLRHGVRLEPGACVFDVGANIGMFSLYVATHCSDATVFAFEPIPAVCDVLRMNAELHGCDVRPMDVALSDHEGDALFTFYPKVSIFSGRFGDAGRERDVVETFLRNQHAIDDTDPVLLDELLRDRLVTQTVRCPMTTVSAVMRTHAVPRIDLLKIDVEKSELAVLRGITADDWTRIGQVIVEVHDEQGQLGEIRSLLEAAGFNVAVDQDPALAGTRLYSVYATRHTAAASAEVEAAPARRWSSPDRLVADLRQHLIQTLPDYMVPSIALLDTLPLTPNGKLDRRELSRTIAVHRARVAPRTPLEEQIAAVWCDVLRVDSVGVTDDFFALGGHSLSATKVVARLRTMTSIDLPLRAIFEAPTIEALTLALLKYEIEQNGPIEGADALAEIERT